MSEKKQINIPTDINSIKNNPVLKPISDFIKAGQIFEDNDNVESNYLKKKIEIKEKYLATGIYDESKIVKVLEDVFESQERLLLLYQQTWVSPFLLCFRVMLLL